MPTRPLLLHFFLTCRLHMNAGYTVLWHTKAAPIVMCPIKIALGIKAVRKSILSKRKHMLDAVILKKNVHSSEFYTTTQNLLEDCLYSFASLLNKVSSWRNLHFLMSIRDCVKGVVGFKSSWASLSLRGGGTNPISTFLNRKPIFEFLCRGHFMGVQSWNTPIFDFGPS